MYMRRIPDNPTADNKIMEQHDEWHVVRRTEVTIETHTVTTFRKQPFVDVGAAKCDPVVDAETVIVPETGLELIQGKWRRS